VDGVTWVVATIIASLAAGVAVQRRLGERASALARTLLKVLLYGFTPPVVFLNIVGLHIDSDVGGGIVIGWVALILAGVLAWLFGRHVLKLPPPSNGVLVNISLQGNTNYLGLPLCAAVLGTRHLPEAIAYDSFVQAPVFLLGVFGVAAAMGTKAGGTAGERIRSFVFKNPVLLAVVAGLLAPASFAPAGLVSVSHVIVFVALPWGFFSAGIILAEHLSSERRAPRISAPVGAAVMMRLVLAPLLLLALAAPFIDLPPAYLLAAATPAGLNGLTVAHAYGLDLRFAASSLAWTTAVGVVGMSALALAA
jgi:malate permease and related proteins